MGRWEGGESQKGMHPTWGLVSGGGSLRGDVFEGISRGVRGYALASRGHPYMFSISPICFRSFKLHNVTITLGIKHSNICNLKNVFLLSILKQTREHIKAVNCKLLHPQSSSFPKLKILDYSKQCCTCCGNCSRCCGKVVAKN